ncbi:ABC transporter substrate-binding protein [Chelatococcus reniformis]|uniref:ABC transporter substrate-binding protein n=1 Tax=Chelatococcus reniformis TaxID=1494448 RepID=A0A916ULN1_9HYPH|nr:ABC transporter substrate-binding protein [Chelatococcus reniformis]GGC76647.1 ABC transporter substrate-binding protein [Chelatococcus reniformis]
MTYLRTWAVRALVCALTGAGAASVSAAEPFRIGVLDDMTSSLADQQGPGDVVGVKMAVADFGGKVLGRPIEVLAADHQNKPDIGSLIARQWYEKDDVQAIVGLGHSGVALAVQQLTREKNRVQINTAAGSSDLTGKACSPNSVHWVFDSYSFANSTAKAVMKSGHADTWFFITLDYAYGHALERDASNVVKANGGKVIGSVRHPLNSSDMASYLLQAQNAKANVIALANSGGDTINGIKQAKEFGVSTAGQQVVALTAFLTNIHAIGLETAKGTLFADAFYWDQSDEARAFSKRFQAIHGRPPTSLQAGAYGATLHYLKAVEDAGSADPAAVMAKMRAMPINDVMTKNGRIRPDGRVIRDIYIFEVKNPAESKGEWDLLKLKATIPGDEAFRPLNAGDCPLVQN